MKNLMKPNRRSFLDDVLFVTALAIPALVAAARYVETDREMTTLAKLQEARTTAVAQAPSPEKKRIYDEPIAWRAQSGAAQIAKRTP